MGGGLVAYRLEKGPGPYPERGILEPAEPLVGELKQRARERFG